MRGNRPGGTTVLGSMTISIRTALLLATVAVVGGMAGCGARDVREEGAGAPRPEVSAAAAAHNPAALVGLWSV